MITTADSPASPPLATMRNKRLRCQYTIVVGHLLGSRTAVATITTPTPPTTTTSSLLSYRNEHLHQQSSMHSSSKNVAGTTTIAHVDNNCIGRQPVANNDNTTPFFAVANSKCVAATFSCFNIKAQKQQCLQQ